MNGEQDDRKDEAVPRLPSGLDDPIEFTVTETSLTPVALADDPELADGGFP